MRRLALTRHLEEAFPDISREVFWTWIEENELHSTLGYTIVRDKQCLTLGFKKNRDGTPLDPADPLVAGYWEHQKEIPNGDTLEAFKARAPRRKPGEDTIRDS